MHAARSALKFAALCGAVLASVATSEAPPPETVLTPIAPYDRAIVLAPGTSTTRTFSVGLPTSQLNQITQSWGSAGGLIEAVGGPAEVELELEGPGDIDSVLIGTDPSEPYEDSVLIDGLMFGCVDSSGTCWATWTVTATHVGGTGDAEFHWSFDAFATSGSGALTPSVVSL